MSIRLENSLRKKVRVSSKRESGYIVVFIYFSVANQNHIVTKAFVILFW